MNEKERQLWLRADCARKIVERIEKDFTDRRGLRQQWDEIDEEMQEEIRGIWLDIVKDTLAEYAEAGGQQ